jgi:hypothetical protein
MEWARKAATWINQKYFEKPMEVRALSSIYLLLLSLTSQ